jgi:hypothetical protein
MTSPSLLWVQPPPQQQEPQEAEQDQLQSGEEEEEEREERVNDLYFHTGGRIRGAIRFLKNRQEWRNRTNQQLCAITVDMATLAVTETKSSISEDSIDRFRTMFQVEEYGGAHQIVDSQFVARGLRERLQLGAFHAAYQFAVEKGLMTAAGVHFEELLHCFFKRVLPLPVASVLQSSGTGLDGVQQLRRSSSNPPVYWIPSVPNFANLIDAVFVDSNRKLWCIQYTVLKTHKFNLRKFRTKFLNVLNWNDSDVHILFAFPETVEFQIPEEVRDEYECTKVPIDCTTVEAVENVRFPFLNNNAL